MIVEVVPGVSWYDNFHDTPLGVNVPSGWTKYGPGSAPTVVATPAPGPSTKIDSSPMGGRYLEFNGSGDPVALGLDIAGSPPNFEVLIKLRTEFDCPSGGASSLFGGPGGRIALNGANLVGLALNGGNIRSRTYCHWRCQLGPNHHLYEPPQLVRYRQQFYLKTTSHGTSNWDQYGYLGSSFSSGGWIKQSEEPEAWWPDNDTKPGDEMFWSWMKLRVNTLSPIGTSIQRIRGKWWKGTSEEPTGWLLDVTRVINAHWPAALGPVGIVNPAEAACASKLEVDYVAVSIDPENTPAPEAVVPEVQSCPTAARVGQAYSFQLEATGVNI